MNTTVSKKDYHFQWASTCGQCTRVSLSPSLEYYESHVEQYIYDGMEKVEPKWKFVKPHNQIVLFLVPRSIILTIWFLKSSTLCQGKVSCQTPLRWFYFFAGRGKEMRLNTRVQMQVAVNTKWEPQHVSFAVVWEGTLWSSKLASRQISCFSRRAPDSRAAARLSAVEGGRPSGEDLFLSGNSCGISGKTFLHLEFLWNLLLCFWKAGLRAQPLLIG